MAAQRLQQSSSAQQLQEQLGAWRSSFHHVTTILNQLQVHFSCDDRAKAGELGTFREYATGETAHTYVCPECDKGKRQRTG